MNDKNIIKETLALKERYYKACPEVPAWLAKIRKELGLWIS